MFIHYTQMERLITYVKNAFKDYLLNKYWMDKGTRKRAEEKASTHYICL